jgi:cysteine desulfurase
MNKNYSLQMPEIYLDYNATTPVVEPVRKAVNAVLEKGWGNPSSGHRLGQKAKSELESARAKVASLLKVNQDEIFFTSGGTESNNTVIIGICQAISDKGRHIITTCIEHPSIINPCLHLLKHGWDISFIKVNSQGVVNPLDVENALRDDTVLISVMLANNETGALQPVTAISQLAHKHGILMHTDAAQAVGKIPLNVRHIGVDYLSVAGHKLYAPKGIGALYCRKGAPLGQLIFGAGQEKGLRPGTEPVPLAVGLGVASEFVDIDIEIEAERQKGLREKLYDEIIKLGHPVVRHSNPENTLPNTLSISFIGLNGNEILMQTPEIMASTGAACHEKDLKISHVLVAMGVSSEVAMGTLRLTVGRLTTESEIEIATQAIGRAIEVIKK